MHVGGGQKDGVARGRWGQGTQDAVGRANSSEGRMHAGDDMAHVITLGAQ